MLVSIIDIIVRGAEPTFLFDAGHGYVEGRTGHSYSYRGRW